MDIRLGLTFDDMLLQPGESSVLPSQANTSTQVTREIRLNIPIPGTPQDRYRYLSPPARRAQASGSQGDSHRAFGRGEDVAPLAA
jgi:IMP dehydrogenase